MLGLGGTENHRCGSKLLSELHMPILNQHTNSGHLAPVVIGSLHLPCAIGAFLVTVGYANQ